MTSREHVVITTLEFYWYQFWVENSTYINIHRFDICVRHMPICAYDEQEHSYDLCMTTEILDSLFSVRCSFFSIFLSIWPLNLHTFLHACSDIFMQVYRRQEEFVSEVGSWKYSDIREGGFLDAKYNLGVQRQHQNKSSHAFPPQTCRCTDWDGDGFCVLMNTIFLLVLIYSCSILGNKENRNAHYTLSVVEGF